MNKATAIPEKITRIQEALGALGVKPDTLSESEKKSLREQGFVIFQDVIDPDWLEALRARCEVLMEKEGVHGGIEAHEPEVGARRLGDLVNKGEIFDQIYTHPKILSAIWEILQGEFKLSSLNARDAMPGQGHQALHADWGPELRPGPTSHYVANSIWMLDDFTLENGTTRVVPGSHLVTHIPGWSYEAYAKDLKAPHPDQVLVTGKAGSVIVLSSHLLHGGTQNQTQGKRRTIHSYYTSRHLKQQTNQREYLRKSTYDRLSPAARYILDVD